MVQGQRNLRVTVGNDSVEADLMEVGRLQLQHLEDSRTVDLVCGPLEFLGCPVLATESRVDELFAILVQKVEGGQMRTTRDLDELRKPVPRLPDGKGAEEFEIEEGMYRSVVCTEAVLVVAIVHGDLDGDGCVDEADDSGRNADEVGIATVCCTGEADHRSVIALLGRNKLWLAEASVVLLTLLRR
jgi:hypothetical protein